MWFQWVNRLHLETMRNPEDRWRSWSPTSNNHLKIDISKKNNEFVDYKASNMDFPAEKLQIWKHEHIRHTSETSARCSESNVKNGHNLLLCSWVTALSHGEKSVVDLWPFGYKKKWPHFLSQTFVWNVVWVVLVHEFLSDVLWHHSDLWPSTTKF